MFTNALTQGRTRSCGCDKSRYAKNTGEGNYRFTGFREIRGSFWSKCLLGAKARGLIFDVTVEYAWELFESQGRRCAISGVPIEFGVYSKKATSTTASLDRLDNTNGYIVGNVQWVHKRINIMRNTLSVPEFVEWCGIVASHAEVGKCA